MQHKVSLWPLLPADALEHYRRGDPIHDDFKAEMRAVFGRTADEPLPDVSVFPKELIEFECPPGTYFDAFPLLLLTDSTLQAMAAKMPGALFDARRFRPNLLITGAAADVIDAAIDVNMPEMAWRGHKLKIGETVLRVPIECPRCVMVTHEFADLPKDPSIMRALVRETGGNLGVYATAETPGVVRVGDAVELLSDSGYVKPQRAWLRRPVFAFRVTLAMMRARRRKKRAQRGG